MKSRILKDDEILSLADKIKRRHMNERRKAQALAKTSLMIRWDNSSSKDESYSSIDVPTELLKEIIEAHFDALIKADDTSNVVSFRKRINLFS